MPQRDESPDFLCHGNVIAPRCCGGDLYDCRGGNVWGGRDGWIWAAGGLQFQCAVWKGQAGVVQGQESLRQWLSCVGRIPPMTDSEVPAWAIESAAPAAQTPAVVDGGTSADDGRGGESGRPRKSLRRRRAQVESLADEDQDAFWNALIGADSDDDAAAAVPAAADGSGTRGPSRAGKASGERSAAAASGGRSRNRSGGKRGSSRGAHASRAPSAGS